MKQHKIITDNTYNGHLIQAGEQDPVHKEILDAIDAVMTEKLNRHSKLFCMGVTLTFPAKVRYDPGNIWLNILFNKLRKYFNRLKLDPGYVWCREHDSANNHHYHIWFFLNGHLTQDPRGHIAKIEQYWASTLGLSHAAGLVHYHRCDNGRYGMKIHRGNKREYDQCYYAASYLSKSSTKDNAHQGVRNFGRSQARQ